MNGATASPMTRRGARARRPRWPEVAHQLLDVGSCLTGQQCDRDRVGEVGRERLGLRSVHGHHNGRVKGGAVELSQHRHRFAHLGQLLARWYDGHAQVTELVFDPRPSGADTHLEATLGHHRQRMRFPRRGPRRTQRRGIHPDAHPQVGEGARGRGWGRAPAAIAGRAASGVLSNRCRRGVECGLT
jgi:hypothetical protein